YEQNTPAKLDYFEFRKDELNMFNKDCAESEGCQINFKTAFTDAESNASLSIIAGGSEIYSSTKNGQELRFASFLEDGVHELKAYLVDGGYSNTVSLGEIDIDTKPPEVPKVLYHSPVGSRSGVSFILEENQDRERVFVEICEQNSCFHNSEFTTNELNFRSATPLENKRYEYRISAFDKAGNLSEPSLLTLEQVNDLLEIIAGTNNSKISPKNNDGLFDSTEIIVTAKEELAELNYELYSSSWEIVNRSSSAYILDGKNEDGKLLEDGIYFIRLFGLDKLGYKFAEPKPIKIWVDNTPPKLY
ncbi:MAG: hypothetical protein ACOCXP_02530, partial [Candidatus Dojkabacteria bacterium]